MKKLMNKDNIVRVILCSVCFALVVAITMKVIPTPAWCTDALFDSTTEAISDVQQKIVNLCLALCPLALICCLALMMLTHNDKKMATLQHIAVIVLVATALILVVNSGLVVETIKNWFDGWSG